MRLCPSGHVISHVCHVVWVDKGGGKAVVGGKMCGGGGGGGLSK